MVTLYEQRISASTPYESCGSKKSYMGKEKVEVEKSSRLKNKTVCGHFDRTKVKFDRTVGFQTITSIQLNKLQSELQSRLSGLSMKHDPHLRMNKLAIEPLGNLNVNWCTTSIEQTAIETLGFLYWTNHTGLINLIAIGLAIEIFNSSLLLNRILYRLKP